MDSQVSETLETSCKQHLFVDFLQPPCDDLTIEIVDNEWRKDKLPNEDIQVSPELLPDPENNEDGTSFSLNQVFYCNIIIKYGSE